jgi:uncharacterized protein (DUF934 family)
MDEKIPPILIKDDQVLEDEWVLISKEDVLEKKINYEKHKLILPLSLWLENKSFFIGKSNIGIWIDSSEDPGEIGSDCNQFSLIAINFPIFTDGRGYSYARILRDNLGFLGDLRAIGDILCDQMYFYRRCGFSSFLVRGDVDPEQAIRSLNDFNMNYQSVSDKNQPIFHKRKS